MKKIILIALAVGGLTAFKNPVTTSQVVYHVDPSQGSVTWNAKKVTGEHTGNVKLLSGQIVSNKGRLTGGEFEVDMTSISVTDITNENFNSKLVNHLKSEDFFSVEKFPKAAFIAKVWAPRNDVKKGEPNFLVKGDLTIKGITHEVSFPATLEVKEKQISASATIKVDRTLYDIKYRSGKFFPDIGDKMIDDEFSLVVQFTASAK